MKPENRDKDFTTNEVDRWKFYGRTWGCFGPFTRGTWLGMCGYEFVKPFALFTSIRSFESHSIWVKGIVTYLERDP